MKKALKIVAVVSFLVSVWGAFLWWNHSDPKPTCNGKDMRPGDRCVSLRGGSSDSYEERLASIEDSVPVDKAIFFIAGGVFVVALGGSIALRSSTGR